MRPRSMRKALFGVAQFDRVFQSYTLSMISDWLGRDPRGRGHRLHRAGGSHIVDFGQQEGLPRRSTGCCWPGSPSSTSRPRATCRARWREIAAAQGLDAAFKPLFARLCLIGAGRS